MRTDAKEVRRKVRKYIRESITKEEAFSRVEEFNENALCCRNYHDEPKLGEWLVDYCCCFDIYFEDQRKLLQEWLEETPEEAAEYGDDAVHSLFVAMIARDFIEEFGYVLQCSRSKYNEMVWTYRKKDQRAVCIGRGKYEVQHES